MSSGPVFVIVDMNFSRRRIDVVNLSAEDPAGTRSLYQEVLGLPLSFEDENTVVFELENTMVCLIGQHLVPGGWYLNCDPVTTDDPVVEVAWLRAGDR